MNTQEQKQAAWRPTQEDIDLIQKAVNGDFYDIQPFEWEQLESIFQGLRSLVKKDPETKGINPEEAVAGTVVHAEACSYIVTDPKALSARLRGFPEGTVVNIFICKAEEDRV